MTKLTDLMIPSNFSPDLDFMPSPLLPERRNLSEPNNNNIINLIEII